MNPSIVCLHPVQVIQPDGGAGRGILVKLSTEEGVIRTKLKPNAGDVLVVAGIFDHFIVKAAVVVTGLSSSGFSFRIAAMAADARAHLARYVWARIKPASADDPKQLRIRSINLEPSRRKPFERCAAQFKDTDRHVQASERWLEKLPFDPSYTIAPRAQ
jgi:hypothetical protein